MNHESIQELFALADEACDLVGMFAISPGRTSEEQKKRGQELGRSIEQFLDKHGLKTDRHGALVIPEPEAPPVIQTTVEKEVVRRTSKKRTEEVAELARKTLAESADAIGYAVADMIKKLGV